MKRGCRPGLSSSTDDRRPVGRIGRPHGVRGEVTFLPDTDDPGRFAVGSSMQTTSGRDLVITSVAPYRDRGLILGFEGVTDRRGAESLRGYILTVDAADRRPLDDGEFWPEDLVGLEAVTPFGEHLGVVSGVEVGTAQDRVVVTSPTGVEVLVPFVDDIVADPEGGRIVIDAPEGLFG
jgi:16S rRNA processing protein RimM